MERAHKARGRVRAAAWAGAEPDGARAAVVVKVQVEAAVAAAGVRAAWAAVAVQDAVPTREGRRQAHLRVLNPPSRKALNRPGRAATSRTKNQAPERAVGSLVVLSSRISMTHSLRPDSLLPCKVCTSCRVTSRKYALSC